MGIEVVKKVIESVCEVVSRYVVGHEDDIRLIMITLLNEGHVILYGPPGSAKTMTANLIAKVLGINFKRIQFTPDILPSDIIGAKVIDPKTGELRTVKGPIFTNVLLADEINRGNPKSLSALLEAMQEGEVSIEGDIYELPKPFIVMATLNTIETQGIFPLPVAVLDRFMISLNFSYPNELGEEELLINEDILYGPKPNLIKQVTSLEELMKASQELSKVRVVRDIVKYVVKLVRTLRSDERVYAGPSPRATQHLLKVAKGIAVIDGRDYVIPDDVKYAAKPVLRHRLILKERSGDLMTDLWRAENIIESILSKVEPPR